MGKRAQVGETRLWKHGQFKKVGPGKWEPISGGRPGPSWSGAGKRKKKRTKAQLAKLTKKYGSKKKAVATKKKAAVAKKTVSKAALSKKSIKAAAKKKAQLAKAKLKKYDSSIADLKAWMHSQKKKKAQSFKDPKRVQQLKKKLQTPKPNKPKPESANDGLELLKGLSSAKKKAVIKKALELGGEKPNLSKKKTAKKKTVGKKQETAKKLAAVKTQKKAAEKKQAAAKKRVAEAKKAVDKAEKDVRTADAKLSALKKKASGAAVGEQAKLYDGIVKAGAVTDQERFLRDTVERYTGEYPGVIRRPERFTDRDYGAEASRADFQRMHDVMANLAATPVSSKKAKPQYRGAQLTADALNALEEGATFDLSPVSSWSGDRDQAVGFARSAGVSFSVKSKLKSAGKVHRVVFQMLKPKRGKDISQLSQVSNELEFVTGGQVRIIKREQSTMAGDIPVTYVEVEHI